MGMTGVSKAQSYVAFILDLGADAKAGRTLMEPTITGLWEEVEAEVYRRVGDVPITADDSAIGAAIGHLRGLTSKLSVDEICVLLAKFAGELDRAEGQKARIFLDLADVVKDGLLAAIKAHNLLVPHLCTGCGEFVDAPVNSIPEGWTGGYYDVAQYCPCCQPGVYAQN
jgi:hypothetical protein